MPATVILPHQLFADHPAIVPVTDEVLLVQDRHFFDAFDYHKQKILFHRATMQAYAAALHDQGVEAMIVEDDVETVAASHDHVHVCDVVDHALRERMKRMPCTVTWHDTPMFVTDPDWCAELFPDRDYRMATFYRQQRQRLDVLMDDGDPVGGDWSYDTENREALPSDPDVPPLPDVDDGRVADARTWVAEHYTDNPGRVDRFVYPVTRDGARTWLDRFVADRLPWFGDYQDAMHPDEPFVYHALLSPLLNTGLLTPMEVVEPVEAAYHDREEVPINAAEGFIRQVIGWREFVRCIYALEGEQQRTSNHWGHDRQLPDAFYTGDTGLDPVDTVIDRVQEYAYAHHIERLMVLSNIMQLCEIDPDAVYEWFMELFIDAYDWVMVPNVYGMGQYADGGLIMTKPYISSSNYIEQMSAFPGGDWEEVWDALYWRFIHEHRSAIAENPRMAVMVSHLDRMDDETLQHHLETAEQFLTDLYGPAPQSKD